MVKDGPLRDIEQAVEACEAVTDAEVVVVLAERSGPYRDVRFLLGWVGALVTACVMVWAPIDFSPSYLVPNLAFVFFLAWFVPDLVPRVLRWCTGRRRQEAQVRAGAELAFQRRGVSLTVRRTGVLLYLSFLEGDGALMADVGLRKVVPGEVLGRLQSEFRQMAGGEDAIGGLVAFLRSLREELEAHVPARDSNPDELPNVPTWLDGREPWP